MKDYFRLTRTAWYSYLFVLPLLVAYQLVSLVVNMGQRRAVINGADALIQNALGFLGLHGWVASWLVLAAVTGVVVYRKDLKTAQKPLQAGMFPLVLAESALYALFFGTVVATLTSLVLPGYGYLRTGGGIDFGQKLAASLGAGLYEELVFRLILTGGLIWLFTRLQWKPAMAAGAAVLLSSLIFSGFHYVGAYADPFMLGSFTFRFMAGIALAGLFYARGFAVAAWTHALYDVFLLLLGKG
jgi:hypothetical protein